MKRPIVDNYEQIIKYINQELIKLAKIEGVITYGDLAKKINVKFAQKKVKILPYYAIFHGMLDKLNREKNFNGEPLISVLVINRRLGIFGTKLYSQKWDGL